MDYWAKPGLDRHQALLFCPTLDELIGQDDPVRLLDEILHAQDWSAWTQEYHGHLGQPPIPPWIMAGVILYGLMRRIRSSRQLEYLCGHNFDFMWLAEGRTIDHDTICKFRTRFQRPLKELFKQVCHLGLRMGLIRLLEVAFDGTRVKANASRYHTWTAQRVEAVLAELEAQVGRLLAEAETVDADEAKLRGDTLAKPLPGGLADAKQRQAKLMELLAELRAADALRKQNGVRTPAQLPKADPDASVMPNKEGGYAPNYTPLAATDGAAGLIVDCDVIGTPNEHNELLPSMDRIAENFGQKPLTAAAAGAFATGVNLEGMEARGIDFHSPVESPEPQEGNPAKREDPRQAVAEEQWPNLPRNDKGKLAKSCFVYDAASDTYFCPLGKELRYRETKKRAGSQGPLVMRIYACKECADCPLAAMCLDPNAKRGRTISRDGHEPARQRMHAKLLTATGRTTYNRRMHIGETPFAIVKAVMDVRRFLLRGLDKVRTEWCWVCTAYNLKKLIVALAALRAAGGETTTKMR